MQYKLKCATGLHAFHLHFLSFLAPLSQRARVSFANTNTLPAAPSSVTIIWHTNSAIYTCLQKHCVIMWMWKEIFASNKCPGITSVGCTCGRCGEHPQVLDFWHLLFLLNDCSVCSKFFLQVNCGELSIPLSTAIPFVLNFHTFFVIFVTFCLSILFHVHLRFVRNYFHVQAFS